METSKKQQAAELIQAASVLLMEYHKETGDGTSNIESRNLANTAARLTSTATPVTNAPRFGSIPKKKPTTTSQEAAADKPKAKQGKPETKTEEPSMFDELLAMGSGAKIGERLSQEELEGVLQWLGFSGSVEGKSKTQLGAIILQKLKAADKKTLDELWATYKKQVVEQAKVLQAEVDELKAIADAATEEQRASDDYNKLLEEIEKKEQAIAKLKG